MTHAIRSHARGLLVVGVLRVIGLPTDAAAQSPFDDWRDPVVVELELAGAKDGERLRALNIGRIQLVLRESFTIEVDPFDQRGRRFPRDRFLLGVELGRECDGRVSVTESHGGDLRFSAGRSRGRCRVLLYVPGNLNLEYAVEFEVTGIGTTNYTRRQAEEIAERLYRAILQREVEPSARAATVVEVQRGRVERQISSMLDSREFADLRQRSQPAELLEAFYAGLLDRAPDSAGADDYLREITQGRYREAILNLLQSQEFEASLPSH